MNNEDYNLYLDFYNKYKIRLEKRSSKKFDDFIISDKEYLFISEVLDKFQILFFPIDKMAEQRGLTISHKPYSKYQLPLSGGGSFERIECKIFLIGVSSILLLESKIKPEMTLVHELAHFIDNALSPSVLYFESVNNKSSISFKIAELFSKTISISKGKSRYLYYKSHQECFARATVQYYIMHYYGGFSSLQRKLSIKGNTTTWHEINCSFDIDESIYLNNKDFETYISPLFKELIKEIRSSNFTKK